MKTKLVSLLALGCALLPLSSRGNDIEPTKEFYTAIHRGGAIKVDGDLTDWSGVPVLADPKFALPKGSGTKGNYVLFEEYAGGTWSGPDDQTSAVQISWDEDNVYFGFTVTDDYHENSANSSWNGDSIQLMIADASRTQQVALYNYALGGTEEALGDLVESDRYEAGPAAQADCNCATEVAIKRDTVKKKTFYEIRLPKASLGLTALAAGTKFGLGMAINDGDAGTQNGQKGWGGLGAHALVFGKSPAETALVTLSADTPGVDRLFFSAINPTITSFSFRATDKGASVVSASSAKLTIDNQVVTLTNTKSGDATDFSYTPATIFLPGSAHTYSIEVKDTAGNTVTSSGTFNTPAYTLLTAADKVTVDTNKRGFIWNVHQVETSQPTVNSRTVAQLAGLLGPNVADPGAVGPASGPGTPAAPGNGPIKFIVPEVINFSQTEGDLNGNVTPDLAMPGIPGTTGSLDNIAAEVLTAVEFPAAGLYHFIVNSDDAFRTTFGKGILDAFTTSAGEFNAGRGATDTAFDVYVPAAGTYPMRTLYNEGGGGANIEILSQVSGAKVLLNDTTTDANALKTYQLDASAFPAYVRSVSPGIGATPLVSPKTIEASIVDAGTTVTANTVTLKINGTAVQATSTKTGGITQVTYTPPTELNPTTEYTAELTYTDTAGPRTVSWKFTTGPLSSTLFAIEAEDFDYDGGKTNPKKGEAGMDVDKVPYLGGAYDTLGAVIRVDFVNADGPDSDLYRTETGDDGEHKVNIGTANNAAAGNSSGGSIGIGSNDRVAYTLASNYRIGWVGGGDWANYTRNFPANDKGGWWKVYAALSYDGNTAGQLAGSLDKVTAGFGTEDQTIEPLGSFSAPGSGGWGLDNLVPMKNAAGGEAVVKLTGQNTVRFNMSSGDFDFLLFSAAAPPPPFVSAAPQDSVVPDAVVLDWQLKDTDAKVATASVKVFVENQDVTAKSTVTKTNDITYIHLDMSGTKLPNGLRSWKLSFSDNSTPAVSTTSEGTFTVVPFDVPGIFVIEAEDFNYSTDDVTGGLSNPQKGVEGLDVNVMPYNGGAYDTLSAVEGIDYNNGDGNDSDVYRTEKDENGENEVNITASNGNRYSNARGAFDLTANYRIGWVGAGEWQNYTRTFPKGTYNVWAALSFDGRGAGQLNGSLDLVTSDASKTGQTVQRLGTFDAPGSGGWGRNELVQMKDTEGAVGTVDLEGVKTVRFNLGSGDFDYLLFVPTTSTIPPDGQPKITSVTKGTDGSITVEWSGGGTLEYTPSLSPATWTPLTGQASPYKFTPAAGQRMLFARIKK